MATLTPMRPHAPERTHAQRMAALQTANRIRVYRAAVKAAVKAGRRAIVDVVADVEDGQEPDLETMKLVELLLATPNLGRVRVNTVLQRSRISPSKTLGGLSRRQRLELVAALWEYPSQR